MSVLLLLFTLAYEPRHWLAYPAIIEDSITITTSPRHLFLGVPGGVYIFNREGLRHIRTLTSADGLNGRVKICAYNPAQNELLIATTEQLYHYLPNTGLVLPLYPPFKTIHAIGITATSAFFQTEAGLFQKPRAADIYQPVSEIPEPVTWYGLKDTLTPRSFPFLTPYFIVDEELNICPFTRVWLNNNDRRLFVLARGYGILIYNSRTGFKESELHPGPPATTVNQIITSHNTTYFLANDRIILLDSAGNWRQFSTAIHTLSRPGTNIIFPALNEITRQRITATAMLVTHPDTVLIGTTDALYRFHSGERITLITNFQFPVNVIARVRDSLLVGTDNGLFLWVNDTFTPITDPFARTDFGVFNIAETRGVTFFGTYGGVLKLDTGDTWTRLIPPGFDLSQPVRALAAADRFLFLGTRNGIDIYDLQENVWWKLDRNHGLPVGEITALYADERCLWIAAPGIITRYDYRAGLK